MVILNCFIAGMIRPEAGKIRPETPGGKPSYQFPQLGTLKGIVSCFRIDIAILKEMHFFILKITSYD